MAWHASLNIDYAHRDGKTVVHHQHQGPLRILQSLYPEGPAVCHNVLVHPPGGLVGGDTLDIQVQVAPHAHALITTPGATRFYRSQGEIARQTVQAHLQADSRLEWLPLEALAYNQCLAENKAVFSLAPGAELLGWDITALGLPTAKLPFEQGSFSQHLEVPGVWLEKGRLRADDLRLLNSPLGLNGHRCMASLFFVSGKAIDKTRRDQALHDVRELLQAHALHASAGATSPHPQVLLVRVLAPLVEPAMDVLKRLHAQWRASLWDLHTPAPRVWST